MGSPKNLREYPQTNNIRRLIYLFSTPFLLLNLTTFASHAREYFNPLMLEIDNPHQEKTDLSVFEEENGQAPGVYRVDISVNNQFQETREVEFSMQPGPDGKALLSPCLSVSQLSAMGVKTALFPDLGDAAAPCARLDAIPQASAEFRFSAQQLLLSIPQAAIAMNPRDYVPETQWDDGITALLLNYSVNGATTLARDRRGTDSTTQYANLRPGMNIGPWRLRNYTTFQRDNNGRDSWDTVYTYLSRDIRVLKSQLMLGDSASPSDIFDSVPFRGAQLASDEEMIPDSMKGYAPAITGIARTNAQVIIRQNGYVIYQSYVAPGAFEINDMYATGGSGDLYVTIKEDNGSEQNLIVPFASLPVLQREQRLKYSLTSGLYRSYDRSVEKTPFSQATLIYGLPRGFTLYGGGQFADHYQSLALGVGKNLGEIGAISLDVTQGWSKIQSQPKEKGQSWRIRYSKNIVETGTNFAIAGYRYSTDGYYTLAEVMDTWRGGSTPPFFERRRNRTELSLSQNLWERAGSLSLSLINEDYWNSGRTLRSMSAGYNNSWNGISYGLNYSYNINSTSRSGRSGKEKVYDRDQVFSLNVSIPLSRWLSNAHASWNVSSSQKGSTNHTVGLNGTTLEGNNLSWSIQQGYGSQGTGNSGNLNADYRGTYAEATTGYAYDKNSQRLNYGLQGGIVAHASGVTFGQPLGETIVLVQAPGASGVGVSNQSGVKTDWRGYTIVPYTSPYRKNQVQLNTLTLPDNVELTQTTRNVVPTRGAVVQASFNASVGQRVMMTLLLQGGMPVPFGAMVSDTAQKSAQAFIVGDGGQVYLTGLADSGALSVKWGKGAEQQCQVNYSLVKSKPENSDIQIISQRCH
ncbi:fimbria/pilus outer membrane usher protein [Citrobacter braakii]|jgi:outer membrane usher protein|uniref:fimbria/pilus outer membrane usher protein n=1 Tax=Citrobacter TaxID=544 RepID=UPI001299A7CA|nr:MULTISPECIES: fimbria/pilus outer membrane usher protein [Citrobacter]MDU2942914.1 fimbria/pilus outer membrane usher protein [Citrobacter sp.]QGG13413.1 fimbria/pilus outer membrane usher protein [Citrobacter braakii]WFW23064.1 fimbrial biogenesis outer membrane usher protein [Citrobacter braakii]